MKLKLTDNGLDSLRKGYEALNLYDDLVDSNGSGIDKSLALKGAILHIHHGIEILMKYILSQKSEFLLFTNIDDNVKKAYQEKHEKNLSSIFEVSIIDKLHTVSYSEAFERLTNICNHKFSKDFTNKIKTLNLYRNRITHSEAIIADHEISKLFDGLIDLIDMYFFKYIGSDYKTISGYSDLVNNYQKYIKYLKDNNKPLKADVLCKLVEIFKKLEINMGINEVKQINDITLCTKIFQELYLTGFKFGTDLYNGCCSGDVSEIKRIDDDHFSLFCKDNNGEEIFKFKSLIIFNPEYESNFSPIFIFEAADDDNLTDNELAVKRETCSKKNKYIIEGLKISSQDGIIIDSDKLQELYYKIENEPIDFEYHHVTRHLSKCMFSMINIQGLNYGRFNELIHTGYNLDGAELKKQLEKQIKS